MADDLFNVHVEFPKWNEIEFNKRPVRRAFQKIGEVHMRDARRLIMRRTPSRPGGNPALQTGLLAKSIGYYVPPATTRRPGFMVRIAPNQRRGKGQRSHIIGPFYPAFLSYGVRRGAKRQKSHHKGKSGGSGWRIAPRNNYMVQALEARRAWTKYVLLRALRGSLRAKWEKRK